MLDENSPPIGLNFANQKILQSGVRFFRIDITNEAFQIEREIFGLGGHQIPEGVQIFQPEQNALVDFFDKRSREFGRNVREVFVEIFFENYF